MQNVQSKNLDYKIWCYLPETERDVPVLGWDWVLEAQWFLLVKCQWGRSPVAHGADFGGELENVYGDPCRVTGVRMSSMPNEQQSG